MKLASGAIIFLAPLLIGCQSSQYTEVSRATNEYISATREVIETTKRADMEFSEITHDAVIAIRSAGCTKPEVSVFQIIADKKENILTLSNTNRNSDIALSFGNLNREKNETVDNSARLLAASRLRVADEAVLSGCLALANSNYRAVIRFFIGTAYAAYRQRAEIGLSDIRALNTNR